MIISIVINVFLFLVVLLQARSERFHLMMKEIFDAIAKAARKPKKAKGSDRETRV